MALAVSGLKRDSSGNARVTSGLITFDNAYATGGESLTPEMVGLHVITQITVVNGLGFSFEYDYSGKLLKAFCPGVVTGAAGAGTLDDFPLSGVGTTTVSIGLTAGNTTTRFGGQVEVANGADLSTVSARFIAVGY